MRIPAKTLLLILIGIAVLAIVVFNFMRSGPFAASPVTLATAQKADLTSEVFGVGTIESRRSYVIGPTLASRVLRVLVDHGDKVMAGQLLAELDPVDMDARISSATKALQRAENLVAGAEAQLREAASRSTLAVASASRFMELRAKGFVSAEAADLKQHEARAATAARQSAEATLAAARRDVTRLAADLEGITRQRAQYRLLSPVSGIISAREAEPGSTVVAGQAVLRLIDASSLWVRARIDQSRAGAIAAGQPAEVLLRSRPEVRYAARVARVQLNSDSVTEERIVELSLDAPPETLFMGDLAEVTIQLGTARGVLSLPTAAIHRIDQQTGIWRIDDGRTVFVPVKTGVQTLDGRVQVLEGLVEGDRVIHYSTRELAAGLNVREVDALVTAGSPP